MVADAHIESLWLAYNQNVLVSCRTIVQIHRVDTHHRQRITLDIQRGLTLEGILQNVVSSLHILTVHSDLLHILQTTAQFRIHNTKQTHFLKLDFSSSPIGGNLNLPIASSNHTSMHLRHGHFTLHKLRHLVISELHPRAHRTIEGVRHSPSTRSRGSILHENSNVLNHHQLLGIEDHGSTEVITETAFRRTLVPLSIIALQSTLSLIEPTTNSQNSIPYRAMSPSSTQLLLSTGHFSERETAFQTKPLVKSPSKMLKTEPET